MKIHDITVTDLTSAILEVRSYFAKRGIYVRVSRKKAQQHFTTSPNLPILVKDSNDTRGNTNGGTRLLGREILPGGPARGPEEAARLPR
jgi:sulfur relay (sulfurtransferase) DsrC/TusE family protein